MLTNISSFGIIFGSLIFTLLVSLTKGRIRILMIIATAIMTAGNFPSSPLLTYPTNPLPGNGSIACATLTNLPILYFLVTLAAIGVGAVIVPNQVVASLITPPDLAATITAATISIRIIGGAVAYAIYYNVFSAKLRSTIPTILAPVAARYGITDPSAIATIVSLIRGGGFERIATVPGVANASVVAEVTKAGRLALVESYPEIYYVSIAFGAVAFVASWGLVDLRGGEMEGGAAVKV